MNKLAIIITVITTAVLVLFTIIENTPRPAAVIKTATSFDAKTTKLILTYECFKRPLETALKELKEEKISLAEATARVHRAASVYSPIYLDAVRKTEPAKTLQESIARNLIGHLRMSARVERGLVDRITSLEIELEEFVRQVNRTSTKLF